MARIHLEQIDLALPEEAARPTLSLRALFRRHDHRPVLRDVSLMVEEGERLAVVGPDAAGKSALLRLLAGLHPPDAGCLLREGEVLHLAGDWPPADREATGRENIERRYGPGETALELADFTGLGEFLDLPVRWYSTGMRWRLEFTLATARSAEVLLVDDLLGSSDLAFHGRAVERLRWLIDQAGVAVVVSRDPELLGLCGRAIRLENGQLQEEGAVANVLAARESGRSSPAA